MNFNSLFIKPIRMRSELCNYQTVRWRKPKKPFWLGMAKSKMFVIPQPKIVPTPEEKVVILNLGRHYNTQLKSLLSFIKEKNPILKERVVEGTTLEIGPVLEKKISESLKMNENWNKESERRREERLKKNMEIEMEEAIKQLDIHEEMRMKQMEIIEEIVKKEKKLSESYVTPENLDEAIENCLNKIDCYDFAIDLEGNKYHGRESLPTQLNTTDQQIPVENIS